MFTPAQQPRPPRSSVPLTCTATRRHTRTHSGNRFPLFTVIDVVNFAVSGGQCAPGNGQSWQNSNETTTPAAASAASTATAATGFVCKAAGGWIRQGGGANRKRRRGKFGVGAASAEGTLDTATATARCRRSNECAHGIGERGRFCSDDAVTSVGGGDGVSGGGSGCGGGADTEACGRRVDGNAWYRTESGGIVAATTAGRQFGG